MRGDDSALDTLYRHAVALLYPSRYEGFGLPLLEAMVRDCPVVCTDLPVLREVGGNAPLFFVAGDSEQAADHLRELTDNEALPER